MIFISITSDTEDVALVERLLSPMRDMCLTANDLLAQGIYHRSDLKAIIITGLGGISKQKGVKIIAKIYI